MVYKAEAQRLHVHMMCHSSKILNIKWWQHIPNKFILKKSKLPSMYNILAQCNVRLEDCKQPKQVLNSKLRKGSCKIGRPKFRYKDIIKRNPRVMNIPLDNWQYQSKNWKNKRKKSADDWLVGWLVEFHGISTFMGYLTLNPFLCK